MTKRSLVTLPLLALALLALEACDARPSDFDSKQVDTAMSLAGSTPTADRLERLATAIKSTPFHTGCAGQEAGDFVQVWRAVELLKYRYNRFPTDAQMTFSARKFLEACLDRDEAELVGPALLGIGYHGDVQDARTIFSRATSGSDDSNFTYAAVGLHYICDPVAGQYLGQLLSRARDDRVRNSIHANIGNRNAMCEARARIDSRK